MSQKKNRLIWNDSFLAIAMVITHPFIRLNIPLFVFVVVCVCFVNWSFLVYSSLVSSFAPANDNRTYCLTSATPSLSMVSQRFGWCGMASISYWGKRDFLIFFSGKQSKNTGIIETYYMHSFQHLPTFSNCSFASCKSFIKNDIFVKTDSIFFLLWLLFLSLLNQHLPHGMFYFWPLRLLWAISSFVSWSFDHVPTG